MQNNTDRQLYIHPDRRTYVQRERHTYIHTDSMYVCMHICLYVSICVSVYQSVCLPLGLSVRPSLIPKARHVVCSSPIERSRRSDRTQCMHTKTGPETEERRNKDRRWTEGFVVWPRPPAGVHSVGFRSFTMSIGHPLTSPPVERPAAAQVDAWNFGFRLKFDRELNGMLNVRRRSLPEKSDAWLDVEGSRTAKLKCSTADYEVIVLKQVIGLSVLCLVRVYLSVSLSLCLRLAMSLRFISVSLCMSLCMSLCLCLFLRSLATPKTRTLFLVNSKTSCVDVYHNIIVIVNSRIRQRYSLNASEVHQLIQYSRALLIHCISRGVAGRCKKESWYSVSNCGRRGVGSNYCQGKILHMRPYPNEQWVHWSHTEVEKTRERTGHPLCSSPYLHSSSKQNNIRI